MQKMIGIRSASVVSVHVPSSSSFHFSPFPFSPLTLGRNPRLLLNKHDARRHKIQAGRGQNRRQKPPTAGSTACSTNRGAQGRADVVGRVQPAGGGGGEGTEEVVARNIQNIGKILADNLLRPLSRSTLAASGNCIPTSTANVSVSRGMATCPASGQPSRSTPLIPSSATAAVPQTWPSLPPSRPGDGRCERSANVRSTSHRSPIRP